MRWSRADQEWLVRVFLIPLLLVGVAALRFAYVRHTRPEAAEDAAGNFHSHVFGIVFIVYRVSTDTALCLGNVSLPCAAGVCNEAFSMFNCRSLDGDILLLRTDFRVDCNSTRHHATHSTQHARTVVTLQLRSAARHNGKPANQQPRNGDSASRRPLLRQTWQEENTGAPSENRFPSRCSPFNNTSETSGMRESNTTTN